MPAKILIVDDESSMREVLGILLEKEGYAVRVCASGVAALKALQEEVFDLVITDLKMPQVSGIEVLRSAKSTNPATEVIVLTAFGAAETAVEAMKLGAFDYIGKPFEVEEFRALVRRALGSKESLPRKADTRPEKSAFKKIIGESPAMTEVIQLLPRLAASDSNVMITGESGTGKELAARAIHELGPRKDNAFVTINCGAIPENLLESELFGHMKGSFTNAIADKKGLFEIAHGGTLFLDEIAELPLTLQVKLLRVIEDGAFRRVGGTETIQVNVRVISATNKDLKEAIREGTFRSDLYYRLNVLPLKLPPLRNRAEDVPLLVRHFLSLCRPAREISDEAMAMLVRYPWWGNVRELENAIERIAVLSDSPVIQGHHIPEEIRMPESLPLPQEIPPGGVNLDGIIEDIEKRYLLKALDRAHGVKTEAAKLLHLSFRSFRHRLSKYGLAHGDEGGE